MNIQDSKPFNEIDTFLDNPKNTIKVTNKTNGLDNTIQFRRDENNPLTKFHNISKEDIISRYESVKGLFNHLYINKGFVDFIVQLKKSNGTNSKVVVEEITLKINDTMLRKSGVDYDAPESLNGASNHSFNNQNQPPMQNNNSSMNHLGALGYASQQAGLGFNELVDLKAKAKAHDLLEADNKAHKQTIAELEITKKSLESQVATANKEKELAIKETQLDQKSFTDSEGFTKLMEAVPSALGMFAQMKQGQQAPMQSGLGTTDNLTPSKKGVVEFITSEQVSEKDAEFFGVLMYKMVENQDLSNQVTELLNNNNN